MGMVMDLFASPKLRQLLVKDVHVKEPLLLVQEGDKVVRLPHHEDAVWLGLDLAGLGDQPVGGGQGQVQAEQLHQRHRQQHRHRTALYFLVIILFLQVLI